MSRLDEIRALEREYDAILRRQGDLLTRTVNALRGNPPPLTSWSHHDIPELAAEKVDEVERLTAERDALAAQVAEGVHLADVWASDLATDAMVHVMDGVVLEAINEQLKRLLELRAALADSEADTSDTQSTDQEDQS